MVVAVGTTASVVALSVGAAREIASSSGHLSEQAATLLATALGALVGALAAYLGGH